MAAGGKGKPRPLADDRGFLYRPEKTAPRHLQMGPRLPGRACGCPVPPQGRGGGPAKRSCADGFAGAPAVARCSGSAAIVTGATGTVATDAGKKHGGNNGVVRTKNTRKARKAGSITGTGNGSTGNGAAGA